MAEPTQDTNQPIIGTHYFGFAKNDWPVGFLSSVDPQKALPDFQRISDMGFNTVVLVASWGDYEPAIGTYNQRAFDKMSAIVGAAEKIGLDVYIRMPYYWNLTQRDSIEDRQERIFLERTQWEAWNAFLVRMKTFADRHSAIKGFFGSWEDFLIIEEMFFDQHGRGVDLREAFEAQTGYKAKDIVRNGQNYEVFVSWFDDRILALHESIQRVLKNYSFEVRVDSDPKRVDGKLEWLGHEKMYKLHDAAPIAYWAPYYGATNTGQPLTADKALKSVDWLIAKLGTVLGDASHVWLDQMNIVDNTYGTDNNDYIAPQEMKAFLQGIAERIPSKFHGYALWTLKNYRHNVIADPLLLEPVGLYWTFNQARKSPDGGVIIPPGGYIEQTVRGTVTGTLSAPETSLKLDISSGTARAFFNQEELIHEADKDTPTTRMSVNTISSGGDLRIVNVGKKDLVIKSVALYGHEQGGDVFDQDMHPLQYYPYIVELNAKIRQNAAKSCSGFGRTLSPAFMAKGIFADNWTGNDFSLCFTGDDGRYEISFTVVNTIKDNSLIIRTDDQAIRFALKEGVENISLCKTMHPHDVIRFAVEKSFSPRNVDPSSEDERALSINFREVSVKKCDR
ncbi:hypothetical protein [Pseudodesulfovibrio karagichevae]|uniref:Glycoside hydrolase family 42 N-terminal domain-containing protein n=1 Tax=Pseudodesulfovibrio karagichevae TaxID=3239305 RepID=A0ABV4K6Q2_9BACT